uniref:PH domain-containing protein n=1 Tax=Plectus sambesii TaxID=2011161 RepID=A0A914X629_9BILA
MNVVLYSGRLFRHKRTFLGGHQWKECWIVLRADGQLIVYNNKQCSKIISRSLNVITAKAGLCIGSEALASHHAEQPPAPFGDATVDALYMTLPRPVKKKSASKSLWFYFKSERDLVGWVRAFAKVIGREYVFDAIIKQLHEQERQLQEELEDNGTDMPAVTEQYEESSKHSGLSIRGEAYRQKRGERNFGSIWTRVLHSPPAPTEQVHVEQFVPTESLYETPFRERLVSDSPSTSHDTLSPDNGYHTQTAEEDAHDTALPCEVTVTADVHSQHSESAQPSATRDDQWSSGRASDEEDATGENVHHRHSQPTAD